MRGKSPARYRTAAGEKERASYGGLVDDTVHLQCSMNELVRAEGVKDPIRIRFVQEFMEESPLPSRCTACFQPAVIRRCPLLDSLPMVSSIVEL